MKSSLLFLLLFLPFSAGALVRISEVMYDLEGSDTGREWIEIVNEGTGSVDVLSFRLFEANTNHSLTLISGSPVLAEGGHAVIADNAEKFFLDWPGFSGPLFESSFSLSNTGEALGIKNGALGEEDSVSYTSEQGAQGDGYSLIWNGSIFAPGTPTPGQGTSSSSTEDETGESSISHGSDSGGEQVARITAYAGKDRVVVVGADILLSGEGYGTEGTPLLNARYVWSFGDGGMAEGKNILHRYSYPGVYVVMLSLSSGDYTASDKFTLEAVPANLSVRGETDGSVSVFNRGTAEIDLGRWMLRRGDVSFIVPLNTILLPQAGIRVHPSLTGFSGGPPVELLYPSGALAASEFGVSGTELAREGLIERVSLPVPTRASVLGASVTEDPTEPVEESFVETLSSPQISEETQEEPLFPWVAALSVVIAIGVGGIWYSGRQSVDGGSISAEQFQIIDISELDEKK